MELKALQNQASKVFIKNLKRDNIEVSGDYLLLKLGEELGEFNQSYLIHKRRCRPVKYVSSKISKKEMSKELADVLGITLVIAQKFGINLEEALVKKWITREWLKK